MKYKQYQKYKDSGVEWIGEIPELWEINKIKFTSYVKGRIGYHGLRSDEFIDDGPYLITGTDFQDGGINWDTCYHVEQWRYEQNPYIQIKKNDVLITKDGTIGKIAFINNTPGPTTLNSHLLVLRPLNNHYIPRFLYWVFLADYFTYYVNLVQTGTTFFGITQDKVENFIFTLPSYEEQEEILQFLDKETTQFDNLISKSQSQITLLQEKRQALINHTVTKGLDPTVPMKDSGIEWIGEIPEHWEKFKLGFLCEFVNGYAFSESEFTESGYPIIRIQNLNGGKNFVYSDVDLPEKQFAKKDDLLFAWSATFGPYIWNGPKASFHYHQWKIIPKKFVDRKFLYYYLDYMSETIRSMSHSGIGMVHMTKYAMEKVTTFIPKNEEEIKQISQFLQKETTQLDDLISKSQSQITLLQEKRQALITAAVTGKIDVRNGVAA